MAIGYNESQKINNEQQQYYQKFTKLADQYYEANRYVKKLQGQQNKTESEKKQLQDWKDEKENIYTRLKDLNILTERKLGKGYTEKLPLKL